MKHLSSILCCAAVLLPLEAHAGETADATSRSLSYPRLDESGVTPPELHLSSDRVPLTVFFPGAELDARAAVHLVSAPERVELRVAEKAAYLLALPASDAEQARATPILLTLTLGTGRPLTFVLLLTAEGETADSLVEVHLPEEAKIAECPAKLAVTSDLLAACRERAGGSGVELVARLIARANPREGAVAVEPVGWRDKQHHLFVEVVDRVQLGPRTFVRLSIENRNPRGPRWRPGELRVQTDDPLEPRRLAVQVAISVESIGPREQMVIVAVFETPQLPRGTHLKVVIPEAEGKRHLVAGGL